MSIKDVIKKSILESDVYKQVVTPGTIVTIIVALAFSLLVGTIIYKIYKMYYKGAVYSHSFAVTLVGMTVLTCMVTLAISTNIVISLGMVGALSIVRYRTAIKEPLDLMYMFWAITTGITIGANMYFLVLLSLLIMYIMVRVFDRSNINRKPYLLIIHYQKEEVEDEIKRLLDKNKYQIRSKIYRKEEIELTIQISCKNENMSFAEKIGALKSVKDVAVLEFNGEYHG